MSVYIRVFHDNRMYSTSNIMCFEIVYKLLKPLLSHAPLDTVQSRVPTTEGPLAHCSSMMSHDMSHSRMWRDG